MATGFKACRVADCKGDAGIRGTAQGYCRAHYRRLLRHGDALAGRTRVGAREEWIEEHKDYGGDECLIWPFSRNESGYCQIKVDGSSTLASRVMCQAAHGAPPDPAMQAAHSCGQGHAGCMNPRHLRWATVVDNNADQLGHGTRVRGSAQGSAKLCDDDVRAIRRSEASQCALAAKYGVSRAQIARIQTRSQWAWLD